MEERIDLVDARLIEALQRDARMPLKELARAAGVSIPTVRHRIQRLLKLGVIKKFTVVTDASRLEGKQRVLALMKLEPASFEAALEELSAWPEAREVHRLLGAYDIAARFEVDDLGKLSRLLARLQGLRDLSLFLIHSSPKEEYGSSVEPNVFVRIKCEFCHKPIYGKPLSEVIGGIRYYFSSMECLQAYKRERGS
jgi:DNA-binding Lrp family transcriptional regulator